MQNEKMAEAENVGEEGKKMSDKPLIILISIVLLLFAVIIGINFFLKSKPQTIEDLHILNLEKKLSPDKGYVYRDVYSFVTLDNFWYTQLTSPKGTKLYNMALRYSPRDLENITIYGWLNSTLFNNATEYYVTFNPSGKDFSHVALTASDFHFHMTNAFGKMPIAACDRNETSVCKNRPIINCTNTNSLVLMIKESEKLRVAYNKNCIIIEGNGFDLVRGVDRVLYDLYGIME